MAQSSTDFWAAIEPVANRSFWGLDQERTKQFSEIFKVGSDDEPVVSWAEAAGVGNLIEKAENAPVTQRDVKIGPVKSVRAATYAIATAISMEAAKDVKNRFPRIVQAMGSMGRAVDVTPELLTALFLDRAFNSSYPVSADGKELCATDHTLPDGVTTVSNELATPAPLDETAMEDIMVALRTMTGSDGNIEPLTVKSWIVPSALDPIAWKLVNSQKSIGSANNDPSYVKGKKVITFDYLGSNTRYFCKTDVGRTGLFWDWIEKPQFITDQVPLNLQKVFVAFFRGRYGCKEFREIYGSAAS